MKKKQKKERNLRKMLITKATKREPLRVLYQKPGQTPEVKIIPDLSRFKKAIIERNLDIVPYKDHFIVCSSKDKRKQMPPHIVFDYRNIAGDLILVKIDKKDREFKSISQEDILWFEEDLIDKSYPANVELDLPSQKDYSDYPAKELDGTSSKSTKAIFERSLINTLIHIELLLTNLTKNKTEGDDEDEEF